MLESKQFQRRLNSKLGRMNNGAFKGVSLACAFIKLEAQKRVPVDEGNLKGSAYTDIRKGRKQIVGEIGFTAEYAAAVHEMDMVNAGMERQGKDAKGKYWDRQGVATNKFLEKAVDENTKDIKTIIKKSIKK